MGALQFLRHEPLVFFIVIASSLFAVDAFLEKQRKPEILIDKTMHASILAQEEALKGSPLTIEEQNAAVQQYIDNKILFDEALRLGLDQDRNIQTLIVRKYKALMSTAIAEPTSVDLKNYYEHHQQDYMSPRLYDLEEYFFPAENGKFTTTTGNKFPIEDIAIWLQQQGEPIKLRSLSQQEILMRMGKEISEQVIVSPLEEWNGPLTNYRGTYFVRIMKTYDPVPKPYEDVERYLRDAWVKQQQENIIQAKLAEQKPSYRIKLLQE